ncbi:unnamed protein product [Rhizophagus irregularis]|nr:unnamed protein product [Rhizophagus irregularis]
MVAPLVSYKLFRSLWTRGISFLINETQFFFSKTNILETEVSDSLFLGLNVWDLDESCTLKKINHSKNRSRIMESLHKWSKQFKCDTLYCCYLHRLTT